MKIENLNRANYLNKKISELENFISRAEMRWTGKIIKRTSKYIFNANAYGTLENVEYEMDSDLKNKVLDVLRERLKEMKEELENM